MLWCRASQMPRGYLWSNMAKYVSHIIDTLNHDTTISSLLDPNTRIAKLLEKHRTDMSGQ